MKHLDNLLIMLALAAAAFMPQQSSADPAPPCLFTVASSDTVPIVKPDGIAVASNGDFVTIDMGNHVTWYNKYGEFLSRWTGLFGGAVGISVDANDDVYIVDMGNHSIKVFTRDGSLVRTWGTLGSGDLQLKWPFDGAIGPDGNLYVTDTGNYCVKVFTPTGELVRKWGTRGTGPGQFDQPYGISVDQHSGDVFVLENNEDITKIRVQRFRADSTFVCAWGSGGSGPGQLLHAVKLAVDETGNVHIADKDNSRVEVFTKDGVLLSAWGSYGTGCDQFRNSFAIAIGANGVILVTDHYGNKIKAFGTLPTPAKKKSWGDVKALYR